MSTVADWTMSDRVGITSSATGRRILEGATR
jgi:hypothetical protein